MIIFNALVAFAIAYLILRKSGGIVRHLIAFVLAAPVAAILTVMAFEWAYPLGYSTARNQMMAYYFLEGVLAAVLGPIAGMLGAWFGRWRRNKNAAREPMNAT